jgi:hypothetical protein
VIENNPPTRTAYLSKEVHDLPRDSFVWRGARQFGPETADAPPPQTARVGGRIIDALKDVRVAGAHPAGAAVSRS